MLSRKSAMLFPKSTAKFTNYNKRIPMDKTISAIRMAILVVLGYFALNLIFGEEQAETKTFTAFAFLVLFDKSLGIALVCLINYLYERWFMRKTAHIK